MDNLNKENNQKKLQKNISVDDENIISKIFNDISEMMTEDSINSSLENNKTI